MKIALIILSIFGGLTLLGLLNAVVTGLYYRIVIKVSGAEKVLEKLQEKKK